MSLGLPEPAPARRPAGGDAAPLRTRHGGGDLPELRDATGYRLDARPLVMSGVTLDDLRAALDGIKPLGFPSVAVWERFQEELGATFVAAGMTDVAARLGGSSRSFFSSPYTRTRFPQNLRELRFQVVGSKRHLDSDAVERLYADARQQYLDQGFGRPGTKPGKHFWDSRYKLHIDAAPCDYDIEVASDFVDTRMRLTAARWRAANLGLEEHFHVGSSGQWREVEVLKEFPALAAFKDRWQTLLGRPVDFECFDGHERLRFDARPDWWRLGGID